MWTEIEQNKSSRGRLRSDVALATRRGCDGGGWNWRWWVSVSTTSVQK